jgi:N-acetylglutamate synthase-like GNAT family acetyltransferase
MPQDYATRLIFDPMHQTILLFQDECVMAVTTFRPFYDHHFVEVVFTAVQKRSQSQGMGGSLMNFLKSYLQERDVVFLVVYADDMAIGFFHRMGFATDFPADAPKKRFAPFIAEYDGATLMICRLHPDIDYANSQYWLKAVNDYVDSLSDAGGDMQVTMWPVDRIAGMPTTPIPTPAIDIMRVILDAAWNHRASAEFRRPVSGALEPGYRAVIKRPMDLQTMKDRLHVGAYTKMNMFLADLRLIFSNCYTFNPVESLIYADGRALEELVSALCASVGIKYPPGKQRK